MNNNEIIAKRFDDYGQRNDYANSQEIMVTITLAEYRRLVEHKAVADHKYESLASEKYKLAKENQDLKERISNFAIGCNKDSKEDE